MYKCMRIYGGGLLALLRWPRWPRGALRWRDAVRAARWGLEYLDLLRDIWASELTSQMCIISKTLRPALAEKSNNHRDICSPSGWSGTLCMVLTALP